MSETIETLTTVDAPSGTTARPELVLSAADPRVLPGSLVIDAESGLLIAVGNAGQRLSVRSSVTVRTDGFEVQREPYIEPFVYADTNDRSDSRLAGRPSLEHRGNSVCWNVPTVVGDCTLLWSYEFRADRPAIEVQLVVGAATGAVLLRDVVVSIDLDLPDTAAWHFEAPGNQVRAGAGVLELEGSLQVLTAGGGWGSPGIVDVWRCEPDTNLLLWFSSRTEIGRVDVTPTAVGVTIQYSTGVAGLLEPGHTVRHGSVFLDASPGTWHDVEPTIPRLFESIGVTGVRDRPEWFAGANMLEVHIGTTQFGDWPYAPYPTVAALREDLPRIAALGITLIEIMPQQPYPSYAVDDWRNIDLGYGDEADLVELVTECHAAGIRVLLDIVIHGVIDQVMARRNLERMQASDGYGELDQNIVAPFGGSTGQRKLRNIAWLRRMLQEVPEWFARSPESHDLVAEHPEWFLRNSAQEIIGIYTRGFDVANVEWQQFFVDAATDLVRRLDIDGFRVDAPAYNVLPNWSPATEDRSSYSPLGCLEMFPKLRHQVRSAKADTAIYTEPCGALYRTHTDASYNYDEHWLIDALLRPEAGGHGIAPIRTARELARWLRARDKALPTDSMMVRHVDSHDTMWWPLPGSKWRREQYGVPAVRALITLFALSGGPFMTYVGGEDEVADHLRAIHRLRAGRAEIRHGVVDYDAVTADLDAIYAVVRRDARVSTVVAVNMSDQQVATVLTVAGAQGSVESVLMGSAVSVAPGNGGILLTVELEPFGSVVVALEGT